MEVLIQNYRQESKYAGTGNPEHHITSEGGMTLRDYLAGQVLANVNLDANCSEDDLLACARMIYKVSDALIKVRNEE